MTIKDLLVKHYNGHAIMGKLLVCQKIPLQDALGNDLYIVQIQVRDDFVPDVVSCIGQPLQEGDEVRFEAVEGNDFASADSKMVPENPVQSETLVEDISEGNDADMPEVIPASDVKAKRGRKKKADATDTSNQESVS